MKGQGSGANPRTAIGQREDGSILLVVIDGRQVNSLGASYSDVIELMLEYGAVNAANLVVVHHHLCITMENTSTVVHQCMDQEIYRQHNC